MIPAEINPWRSVLPLKSLQYTLNGRPNSIDTNEHIALGRFLDDGKGGRIIGKVKTRTLIVPDVLDHINLAMAANSND